MESEDVVSHKFLYVPKSALTTSLYLHVSFIVFFLMMKVLEHFGIPFLIFGDRTERRLFQNYIQIDVIGLPDQMMNDVSDTSLPEVDEPKMAKRPEGQALPKVDDSLSLPPEAEKKKSPTKKETVKKEESYRKEQEHALKRLQEEASREAALKALANRSGRSGRTKLKGNILSKGTAMTGAIGMDRDRYVGLVNQAIKKHFKLYAWQSKRGLSTVIYIEIYPTGMLRQKRLIQSSPDQFFNQAALNAIDASLPLPVPDDLNLLGEGLHITFKPEDQK